MNSTIAELFTWFIRLLIVAIVARSLLTWVPISRTNPFVLIVHQITDPLIQPVRRFMPRTGMIDLSPMIVIGLLYVMTLVVREVSN